MNRLSLSPERLFLELSADLLSRGCQVRFRAKGHCMSPTIRDGETITVAPADPAKLEPGDIVLYRTERFALAHRVVAIEEDGKTYILKGDSAGERDQPVGVEQILGKVVCVERVGRPVDPNHAWARLGRLLQRGASRFAKWRGLGTGPSNR